MDRIAVYRVINCNEQRLWAAAQWPTRIQNIFTRANILTVRDIYNLQKNHELRRLPNLGLQTFECINDVLVRWGFPDLIAFQKQYNAELFDTELGLSCNQIALFLDSYQHERSHVKKRRKNGPINPRWYEAAITARHVLKEHPKVSRDMLVQCLNSIPVVK